MAGDAELLEAVRRACQGEPRPARFTDSGHCCECAEHDAALRAATPGTIGLETLGNPGWDPICFITPEGFRYYLPGLARLALGRGGAYYLDQFLFHLTCPGRIDALTAAQRAAVLALLAHIAAVMRLEVEAYDDLVRLDAAILALVA